MSHACDGRDRLGDQPMTTARRRHGHVRTTSALAAVWAVSLVGLACGGDDDGGDEAGTDPTTAETTTSSSPPTTLTPEEQAEATYLELVDVVSSCLATRPRSRRS